MVLLDAPSPIKDNSYYRQIPYFVTLDGVKVTSIRQVNVFVRNTTFTPPNPSNLSAEPGWQKPGLTKVAISKKAAMQLSE